MQVRRVRVRVARRLVPVGVSVVPDGFELARSVRVGVVAVVVRMAMVVNRFGVMVLVLVRFSEEQRRAGDHQRGRHQERRAG